MAKILIADDNSNIQKMVGLALRDQGVEVVAVGNGEAAVRKIKDVRPDLVLADVFMPVRNGYEVCEFVKKDEGLSHIPVILLVGAFDPLDEHEAQRVGADGVLKKPFVPPEPLISMVRSALSRASVESAVPHLATVSQSEGENTAPVAEPSPTLPPPPFDAPIPSWPTPQEEAPVRPAPVAFEEAGHPVAFSSLLETPVVEPVEDILPVQHPDLSEARSWNQSAEEEGEEDESSKGAWRGKTDDDVPEALDVKPVAGDWGDALVDSPTLDAPSAAEVFVGEASQMETDSSGVASASRRVPTAAAESFDANAPVITPEDAPAAKEPHPVEEPLAIPGAFSPENFPGLFVEERPLTLSHSEEQIFDGSSAFLEKELEPSPNAPFAEGLSSSPSLWEEQVREASRLAAASWPAPRDEKAPVFALPSAEAEPSAEPGLPDHASGLGGTEAAPQAFSPVSAETAFVEADHSSVARQLPRVALVPEEDFSQSSAALEPVAEEQISDWAEATEGPHACDLDGSTVGSAQEQRSDSVPEPAPAHAAASTTPNSRDTDELVAKVLERMDPEILQSMTRALLKPIVEALLRDELEKKP